jgi:glycosyltransferase involved in cell wall biosynthesis
MLLLAIVTLLAMAVMGIELAVGNRLLHRLDRVPPLPEGQSAPLVSIVIAARNEAETVGPALQSVLAQAYPRFEVIVVNDRSEDGTGVLLDEMAGRAGGRLAAVHLAACPDGWLGKTHALFTGAGRAKGDLLLFADADVVMEPTVVSRAVHFLVRERIDHVTLMPRLEARGWAFQAFLNGFAVLFSSFYKPWKAREPSSPFYMGIGAFNLMRASAYHLAGTHRLIAMRPDDDMKLGKIVKRSGFRQDVLEAQSLLRIRWYPSLHEAVRGLMKNAFAGNEYSVLMVIFAVLVLFVVHIYPFAALFLSDGAVQLLNGLIVGLSFSIFADNAVFMRFNPLVAFGYPFAMATMIHVLVRSMVVTLATGGIVWRGTRYPLRQLRANRV